MGYDAMSHARATHVLAAPTCHVPCKSTHLTLVGRFETTKGARTPPAYHFLFTKSRYVVLMLLLPVPRKSLHLIGRRSLSEKRCVGVRFSVLKLCVNALPAAV